MLTLFQQTSIYSSGKAFEIPKNFHSNTQMPRQRATLPGPRLSAPQHTKRKKIAIIIPMILLITSSGEHPPKASLIADLINSFILLLFYCYNVIILSFKDIAKFRQHFVYKIFKVRFPTRRIYTVVSLNHVNTVVLLANHYQYLFIHSHNNCYCCYNVIILLINQF